jgi:hypothetical protein
MDGDLEGREVVAAARRLRELQHAREHGRHEVGVSHLVDLDQLEVSLGIEALHDDCRAAHADREVDRSLRSGVIERCGR